MSLRTLALDTSWGALTIAGGSRAGEGTLVLLPQLRLALEGGRPHRALAPMSTLLVSHGHMDHIGGLGYWASQRYLNSMGPGTVIAPAEIAGQLQALLETLARLEGGRPYGVDVVAVAAGDRRGVRPDIELGFFATDHWVPTLGCRVTWRTQRLLAELSGLAGDEIARRRRAGLPVTDERRVDLLAYCADSGPGLFRSAPEVLAAEVLLVECSFFRPADRERAVRFGHMHLEDLLAVAGHLQCRHLVLLHASRRQRLREVERFLDEQLRPQLPCALHHLVVDWE
ncbi:MAG TPA: MBL fold metallo-hydrolase [Thermoanaerobaculales bacterium]|nr:MBL fold metallo-hydrolase [Thermoanaerobaculales bacterium]HPA82463.1 MBL fold metallo-hydrolase [Thermoanaerobaculales bacterium]HQL30090.1 MBL fold metallo-hydrolase [Thermoanaerobaculales bacterium]HQN97324.1 MBL fold metallo-hydrolase [Thermoanaerobaculales bacterium]HQP42482.1 MBL fold metallo-hydrolase [Thermoanaerobaculales bacterium]